MKARISGAKREYGMLPFSSMQSCDLNGRGHDCQFERFAAAYRTVPEMIAFSGYPLTSRKAS